MIDDFLDFLEYYSDTPEVPEAKYSNALVRIEYDEVARDGKAVIAKLAPFAHAINALCYSEPEIKSYYNQKKISSICCVSQAEVSCWKKEERIPEKYRWFLLLVDISSRVGDIYGKEIIQPMSRQAAEEICDVYLRMVKACYDPYCEDDVLLMESVWYGEGIDTVQKQLQQKNPDHWDRIFKRK